MEKLYYNGCIITMENPNDNVQAVLVADGIIKKVGAFDEVKSTALNDVEMVDLQGKTLMPSFIDGHGHITSEAQMINACNLADCNTFEEIVDALKIYRDKGSFTKDDIIYGVSYDHNFLPGGKHPTKEWLNQVSSEVPVLITHASGHMGCANDVALKMTGVTCDSPEIPGGVIGRIEGTNEPNGYLEEQALNPTMDPLRKKIKFAVDECMKMAQLEYLEYGITTAQDGASNVDVVNMLTKLANEEKLFIDVISYPLASAEPTKVFADNEQFVGKYVNRLKLGGYKAFLDGSPQGKSAWMTKPYENSGDYCGYPWFTDEQAEEFMQVAINDNQQILVHCNGDASGDQFLKTYINAYEKSDNPNKANLRPVMIHCQTAREDQLDIMQKYDFLGSIFVGHVYYWGDVHIKNFGKERGENVSPVQSALDRGINISFHQDTPVTKPKPLHSIWAAVNRITRGGKLIGEHQRCSVYDALKAFTISGAYQYFEEDSKGSLKEGKRADMLILDENPLTIDTMKIKDIKILETIKDGVSYVW